jgi:hypothetical protein
MKFKIPQILLNSFFDVILFQLDIKNLYLIKFMTIVFFCSWKLKNDD